MSDTPRTDAVQKQADTHYRDGAWRQFSSTENMGWALARQLERELKRASSRAERAHAEVLRLSDLLRKADPNWGSPMHLNSVLAVGEPCAGRLELPNTIYGKCQWVCPCGAKRPEDCRTETAKP